MPGCGGGDWLCGTKRTCEHLFHTNLRFHHLGCYQVFKLFLPEQEPVTLQEIFSYYLIVLSSNFIYKQYTHFIYLTNLYRLLNPLHNKLIICTQKLKLLAAFWFGIESRGARALKGGHGTNDILLRRTGSELLHGPWRQKQKCVGAIVFIVPRSLHAIGSVAPGRSRAWNEGYPKVREVQHSVL